jgi:hypothetical protein
MGNRETRLWQANTSPPSPVEPSSHVASRSSHFSRPPSRSRHTIPPSVLFWVRLAGNRLTDPCPDKNVCRDDEPHRRPKYDEATASGQARRFLPRAAPEAGALALSRNPLPGLSLYLWLPIPHSWPQVPRRDHTPSLVQLIRSALSAAIAHPTDAFTRLASSLKSPHDMRVLRPQATARLSVVRLRLATRRQKNTAGYQPPQATT